MKKLRQYLLSLFLCPLFLYAQEQKSLSEWDKINYTLQSDVVASVGKYAPFWFVSNRHGLSSLENNNASLSLGLFREFDRTRGFTWAYGAEIAGAWHYDYPFIVQQLYADVKYNCWELSIGSKERWSEGKHRTLSGGGLTFAPNARPIPQVRFGINEYATVPWWFNEWVKVKGHFSYGRYTDDEFLENFTDGAVGTYYTKGALFHEKTAFVRISNPSGEGLGWESGLEMYTKFGGDFFKEGKYNLTLPSTVMAYLNAFIPMAGGEDSPDGERVNINGNVLGSWHAIMDYTTKKWKLRVYYEHFFEDHSQMLGISWVYDREGVTRFLSYHPWRDGLWGVEFELFDGRWLQGVVIESVTSRDQSGPLLHDTNSNFKVQISGADNYYNHEYFHSWQHWGMAVCNPHFLSPGYNENHSVAMLHQRLSSLHIGITGTPYKEWTYRIMGSHTGHWGTIREPLPNPESVTSLLWELTYAPGKLYGCQFVGCVAADFGNLVGNNVGGMVTIRKMGLFAK